MERTSAATDPETSAEQILSLLTVAEQDAYTSEDGIHAIVLGDQLRARKEEIIQRCQAILGMERVKAILRRDA